MSSMDRGIFQDERAATVVFGTLMIILVTITVASSLALMASLSQKNAMERQSVLDAAENENLKIVTIKPTSSSLNSYESNWESLNITILNLDILDSDIAAISINDDFIINYFLINESGGFDPDINGNPKIYNASKKIAVPSEESVQIHVGGVPILGTVYYDGSFTPLNNSPDEAYPNIDSSGWLDIYDSNGILIGNSSFTVVDNHLNSNIIVNSSIPTINTGNYNVIYTAFLNSKLDPHYSDFKTTHSINVEILSERTNLFSKRFMPPMPIADVQSKTDESGNYLVLDASDSSDLDGFITSYKWEIYSNNDNATPIESLSGNKVRTEDASNVNIDLIVTNNYGMISKLSDISGKITIP